MADEEVQKLKLKSLSNLMLKVDQLRSEFYFTDVTLKSGDKEFPAHKIILSAFSPYFQNLFTDPQNKLKSKVSVDFMSAEVLEIIISYCYSGYIDQVETVKKNIKEILSVSLKLELPALSEYCGQLLLNVVTIEELLPYWKLIDQISNEEIKQNYVVKVAMNLTILRTSKEAEIIKITASQLNSLLQCHLTPFLNQGDILKLVLQWIKYRENEDDDFAAMPKESNFSREKHMNKLLQYVDFSKISESDLLELFDEPLLENNKNYLKACKQLYYSKVKKDSQKPTALVKSLLKEESSKQTSCNNTSSLDHKLPTSDKVGFSFTFSTNFLAEKNIFEKQATKKEIMPIKSFSFGFSKPKSAELLKTVKYHKKVFMLLGNPTGSDIFIYDFQNDKLIEMIAHPFLLLAKAAVCKYECYIYGLGGWDIKRQSTSLDCCYAYNINDEKWLKKKILKTSLLEPQAVTIKDQIFVLQLIGHRLNVQRFEPAKEKFVHLPYMSLVSGNSRDKRTFSVTFDEECLYVLLDKQIWSYHVQSGEQKNVVKIKTHCSSINFKFVCCYGNLYVIEHEKPKRVLIYDLQNKSLTETFVPAELTQCNAMISLNNPNYPEIFVVGFDKAFLYKPPFSWEPLQSFDIHFNKNLQIVLF